MKAIALAAVILMALAGCGREEPTYQGRPESVWIRELGDADATTRLKAAAALIELRHKSLRASSALEDLFDGHDDTLKIVAARAGCGTVSQRMAAVVEVLSDPYLEYDTAISTAFIAEVIATNHPQDALPAAVLLRKYRKEKYEGHDKTLVELNTAIFHIENPTKSVPQFIATGKTPDEWLSRAAELGDVAEIKNALSYGAKVDEPDARGLTPLTLAISANSPDAVEAIIKAGAQVNAQPMRGYTHLDRSEQMGYGKVSDVLRKAGGMTFANLMRSKAP